MPPLFPDVPPRGHPYLLAAAPLAENLLSINDLLTLNARQGDWAEVADVAYICINEPSDVLTAWQKWPSGAEIGTNNTAAVLERGTSAAKSVWTTPRLTIVNATGASLDLDALVLLDPPPLGNVELVAEIALTSPLSPSLPVALLATSNRDVSTLETLEVRVQFAGASGLLGSPVSAVLFKERTWEADRLFPPAGATKVRVTVMGQLDSQAELKVDVVAGEFVVPLVDISHEFAFGGGVNPVNAFGKKIAGDFRALYATVEGQIVPYARLDQGIITTLLTLSATTQGLPVIRYGGGQPQFVYNFDSNEWESHFFLVQYSSVVRVDAGRYLIGFTSGTGRTFVPDQFAKGIVITAPEQRLKTVLESNTLNYVAKVRATFTSEMLGVVPPFVNGVASNGIYVEVFDEAGNYSDIDGTLQTEAIKILVLFVRDQGQFVNTVTTATPPAIGTWTAEPVIPNLRLFGDGYSVATLPDATLVPVGTPTFCNDCLNADGTAGGIVTATPTGWRTAEGVIATADEWAFRLGYCRNNAGRDIPRKVGASDFSDLQFQLSQFENINSGAGTFISTNVERENTTGSILLRSGNVVGARVGLQRSQTRNMLPNSGWMYYCAEGNIGPASNSVLDYEVFMGFVANAQWPTRPTRYACFRYRPTTLNGGSSVLNCACRNAGDETIVATTHDVVGLPGTPLNFYEILTNGAEYRFYINGSLVATITTNLPAGNLGVGGVFYKELMGGTSVAVHDSSLDSFGTIMMLPNRLHKYS